MNNQTHQQHLTKKELIHIVEHEPWTYLSLRKHIEIGHITPEDASEILEVWQKRIDTCPIFDPLPSQEERERILTSEKRNVSKRYPKTYTIKSIDQQLSILRTTFGLEKDLYTEPESLPRTDGYTRLSTFLSDSGVQADGIFYIPPVYEVAKAATTLHPYDAAGKSEYEIALWFALKQLRSLFYDRFSVMLIDDLTKLPAQRLHPKTAIAHARNELICKENGLAFWPIQTGGRRKGESPRYTLLSLLQNLEQPLPYREAPADLYLTACVLLSHPERIFIPTAKRESSMLFIHSVGTLYTIGDLPYCSAWDADECELRLSCDWIGEDMAESGNATFYVPEIAAT